MIPIRYILAFFGLAVLNGLIVGPLSKVLHLNFDITLIALQSIMFMLIIWQARKRKWWDKVNTSDITEDSLQKILLHMLISGTIIVCAVLLVLHFGHEWSGMPVAAGIGFIGLFWMGMATMRYTVWIAATHTNPALADERMHFNIKKSEKWAFIACFNIAITLGFIDYNGWLAISGATVGFSAAISSLIVGLTAQMWFETKDS